MTVWVVIINMKEILAILNNCGPADYQVKIKTSEKIG